MFEQLKFFNRKWLSKDLQLMQATKTYGKYELSVILEPGKTLYEAAILDQGGNFVVLPGIHEDYKDEWCDEVIPCLDKSQVSVIMKKLELLMLKEGV